jgi:DNA-binding NarL/FixJ family response regulator
MPEFEFRSLTTIRPLERWCDRRWSNILASRCVAKPSTVQKAIEAADSLKPDVVVLNVTMPVLNGIEAARVIRTRVPESAIVILSTHADERLIEEARRIGARAFVAKTRAGEALVKAIEAAIEGGDFVLME